MSPKTLSNEHCYIEYREDEKSLFGRDRTDGFNEPAFYTQTKRGIKNAWASIEQTFGPQTTMHDLMNCCTAAGVRTHYWCMVD